MTTEVHTPLAVVVYRDRLLQAQARIQELEGINKLYEADNATLRHLVCALQERLQRVAQRAQQPIGQE